MATRTQAGVDTLNSLLRGEMSAVETYQQAEDKFQGQEQAAELRRIRGEHQQAVDALRRHVSQHGGDPSTGSGLWGTFAKMIEGTAKVFGETAALKALKEGEEHGIKDMESALRNDALPADCQRLVSGTLLPNCREHIQALDRMMTRH